MRSINTEIAIAASARTVWTILAATDQRAQWNPFARFSGRLAVGGPARVVLSPPGKSAVTKAEPA